MKRKRYKLYGQDIADGFKTTLEGYVDDDGVIHITKEKRVKWRPKIYFSKISDPESWSL